MTQAAYVGIDGSARKISSIYAGVDDVARKVVKAYVGVDGVARQWWGDGNEETVCPITHYDTYVAISGYGARSWYSASAEDYAIIAGGQHAFSSSNENPTFRFFAFDPELTYTLIGTQSNLTNTSAAAIHATDTDYALFAGGYNLTGSASNNLQVVNSTVTYVTSDLVRGYATSLSSSMYSCAAANVGDYVIFGNTVSTYIANVYDTELTKTTLTTGMNAGYHLGSRGLFKPYAFFISSTYDATEAYNEELVQVTAPSIDLSADLESLDVTLTTDNVRCDVASEDYIAVAHSTRASSPTSYHSFVKILDKDLVEITSLYLANISLYYSMSGTRNGYLFYLGNPTSYSKSVCIDKDLLVSIPNDTTNIYNGSYVRDMGITGVNSEYECNFALMPGSGNVNSTSTYVSFWKIPV